MTIVNAPTRETEIRGSFVGVLLNASLDTLDNGEDTVMITVCLSVNKITQKVVDGFGINFLGQ